MKAWWQVNLALGEIHEKRLYRPAFYSFEDYCRQKWKIGRAQAYRKIEAAEYAQECLRTGDTLPATENQARMEILERKALSSLTPDEQLRIVIREEQLALNEAPEQGDTWERTAERIEFHLRQASRFARKNEPFFGETAKHFDAIYEELRRRVPAPAA